MLTSIKDELVASLACKKMGHCSYKFLISGPNLLHENDMNYHFLLSKSHLLPPHQLMQLELMGFYYFEGNTERYVRHKLFQSVCSTLSHGEGEAMRSE